MLLALQVIVLPYGAELLVVAILAVVNEVEGGVLTHMVVGFQVVVVSMFAECYRCFR